MADHALDDAALQRVYRRLMAGVSDGAVHPDEATWVRLAHDEVGVSERAAIFDHVTVCDACARLWRGVLTLQDEARAAQLLPHAGPTRSWLTAPTTAYLALAATILLAVTGLVVSRRQMPPASEPASSSAPAVIARAEPPAWLNAFPLMKADIHVTADEALTVRGTPATATDPSTEALAAALEPYRRDDFSEAIVRLEGLRRDYPTAGRPALYLGVSLLQVGRDTEAIEPLRAATTSAQPEVAADARWSLAVAFARTNQPDLAAGEARLLCDAGGPSSDRACAALRALAERQR